MAGHGAVRNGNGQSDDAAARKARCDALLAPWHARRPGMPAPPVTAQARAAAIARAHILRRRDLRRAGRRLRALFARLLAGAWRPMP